MLNTPFSSWPDYSKEEAEAVSRVVLSNRVNYWTGDETREFEREFAAYVGTQYAVALANGTVALDLALKALGVGCGDEVIVTPRTFIASVSSIVNAGAVPVFADVDLNSQNITAQSIQSVLTPQSRAIICVHLAGWPCDMDPIMELAAEHNLFVIEDCAQAHGALYKGRSVGSIGDIGCWSFCQDKIITTGGEGGMVTTNNQELWKRMWSFKDHGKSWDAVYERVHPPGFRWLHESFGTNWRMTEMQAALGRIQLSRMELWHAKRLTNANQIWSAANSTAFAWAPSIPAGIEHAAYKAYIFTSPERRDSAVARISQMGVPCFSGTCSEVYLERAFDATPYRPPERLPNAKRLGETSLMFLVHPSLTDDEISLTCRAIEIAFE